MMKNKIIIAILALVLVLSSCGKNTENLNNNLENKTSSGENTVSDKKLKIVATTFPCYDWVREVAGDKMENIELSLLLDNGVDLHSYSPTADDIVKIKEADMFIYVGGHSDKWVDDVLEATNANTKLVNLVKVLGDELKQAEEVEGMEHHHHEDGEHEHEDAHHEDGEHEHEDAHHEDGEHEHEDKHHEDGEHEEEHHEDGEHEHEDEHHEDEHVWLSVQNAQIFVDEVALSLSELDPENTDVYRENADKYIDKLADLDIKYEDIVKSATNKTLLFADRFPFRYMVDDYGLDYFAAFTGCSAESEASFETIAFLANKIDDLDLDAVLTLEGRDKKLAETIVRTSGRDVEILSLNSMQSITKEDVEGGAKYLDIMDKNADVLKEALK